MLTQAIEVMKYVRASAGRQGLNVVFEDSNHPRHDGRTIYLPRITGATTDEELKQLMASTDHEVAHDRYSSFNILKDLDIDPKGILMFVWNFLEDSRVNVIEANEYRGFRENWDDCAVPLLEPILEGCKSKPSLLGFVMGALLKWETELSAPLFPKSEMATHHYVPNKEIYDALVPFTPRLVACHKTLNKELGTQGTLDLARDILNEIAKSASEELKKLIKEASEGSGKCAKGKGGKEASKSSKASESKGKAEDSKKEVPKDDEYKIVTVKLTEEDMKKSLSIPKDGSPMGKVGINFDPVAIDKGSWDMTDFEKFIVVHYPKGTGPRKYHQSTYGTTGFLREYEERAGKLLITQENFAQQVRRLIQIRAKVQTEFGVKRGKLDQSRLSRITFKQPGFSDRIFKRRIENKTLDAAVSILVDMSGSMCGDKAHYALASTLLMTEVCTTLGIPLEITGFSDDVEGTGAYPTMFVYKAFSDLHVAPEKLKEYFSQSSNFMQGNPDGENILWAYDRLIKRKERKRVLIVMSDGSPAASKSSFGLERFTLEVIKEIESAKKVEIYGLGLCSNSVKSYYTHHSVVSKPSDIPSKLLELIERKIINVV